MSIAEERNLGIPCPVLRMTGAGTLIKAQQKVSSGPRTLGEEPMEGSLPFLSSGLCGIALAPHRNLPGTGSGTRWREPGAFAIMAHHLCHAVLYSTFKSSSKSEGPLRTSAGVSFQDFPFLCFRKQGIWSKKPICLLGRA